MLAYKEVTDSHFHHIPIKSKPLPYQPRIVYSVDVNVFRGWEYGNEMSFSFLDRNQILFAIVVVVAIVQKLFFFCVDIIIMPSIQ